MAREKFQGSPYYLDKANSLIAEQRARNRRQSSDPIGSNFEDPLLDRIARAHGSVPPEKASLRRQIDSIIKQARTGKKGN